MKKNLLLTLGMAAATLVTFTSCDPDVTTGTYLSGCWEGDFGMYITYVDRYGRYHDVDADYTTVEFLPDQHSRTHGVGYQTDFYDYGPYEAVYHSFYWEVRNGDIYLDYRHGEGEELSTYLRDYHISNSHLYGYFGNTSSQFDLVKYAYYDWSQWYDEYGDYYHGYGFGYWEDYGWSGYLAKQRQTADDDATAEPAATEPAEDLQLKMVHYGNRYAR